MHTDFDLFDLNNATNIITELARNNNGEYSHQIGPDYPKYTYHITRDEMDNYNLLWQTELTVYKDDEEKSILTLIIDEECGIIVIFSAELYAFEKSPLNVMLTDMAPLFEAANEKSLLNDILTIAAEEG